MEKQDKESTADILTLLTEIQQLTRHMAKWVACGTDAKQLERDLCTLKGNVFMLEIKIDHAETLLKGPKQSHKAQPSDSLDALRRVSKGTFAVPVNGVTTPKLRE